MKIRLDERLRITRRTAWNRMVHRTEIKKRLHYQTDLQYKILIFLLMAGFEVVIDLIIVRWQHRRWVAEKNKTTKHQHFPNHFNSFNFLNAQKLSLFCVKQKVPDVLG